MLKLIFRIIWYSVGILLGIALIIAMFGFMFQM